MFSRKSVMAQIVIAQLARYLLVVERAGTRRYRLCALQGRFVARQKIKRHPAEELLALEAVGLANKVVILKPKILIIPAVLFVGLCKFVAYQEAVLHLEVPPLLHRLWQAVTWLSVLAFGERACAFL